MNSRLTGMNKQSFQQTGLTTFKSFFELFLKNWKKSLNFENPDFKSFYKKLNF